MLLKIELY